MNVNCNDIVGNTPQSILPPDLLCKGKRKDNGEWIEGYYVYRPNSQCVAPSDEKHYITRYRVFDWNLYSQETHEVFPESVGRYVGLSDKNKKEIFEGDRVNCKTTSYFFEDFAVKYNPADARFVVVKGDEMYPMSDKFEYEIIGNVSD